MTKYASFKSRKTRIIKELVTLLGEENVSDNPAVRSGYRGSNAAAVSPWGKGPEIVVMPQNVEHVQAVVKLANKERLTILPLLCSSATFFFEADITMDMMKMNKIIKIDTENSFIVLEPGVTFNSLDPLLRKEGYVIAHGTLPSGFSVVGNLAVRQAFNHNFSGRIPNQTLGLEIVMLDGSLLRTGTATFGINYWSPLTMDMPDIRGLFASSGQNTPLMGIITKAAIRIWPMMEARGLPIGGFDTFAKAMKYCKAVTKAGIADQSMVWSWVLVAKYESRMKGGKDEIDFLTHRMTADYTKPYKGLHYCYTWTQLRGYKEQVDVNLKLCERIAKEMGGKILTDEELQNTIPNCWESWKHNYQDLEFLIEERNKHLRSISGGEGMGETRYHIGWVDDLIKMEDAFNQRLKEKYNQLPQPYYCRIFEGGVGAHLRYIPGVDLMDEYQMKMQAKMRQELQTWVIDNFPNIHVPGGYRRVKTHSIGLRDVLDKIRDALDPNHIGYLPGEERLEPEEEEGEVATVG